ncbi:unnamed protein product, partial [Symbiodinium pilosum]
SPWPCESERLHGAGETAAIELTDEIQEPLYLDTPPEIASTSSFKDMEAEPASEASAKKEDCDRNHLQQLAIQIEELQQQLLAAQ